MKKSVPKTLAVVRLGAVGDVVVTLAVVASIRHAWPSVRLLFVTRPALCGLVSGHPAIDAVVPWAEGATVHAICQVLASRQVDALLDLHGKWRGLGLRFLGSFSHHATYQARPFTERLAHLMGGARANPTQTVLAGMYRTAARLAGTALTPMAPFLKVDDVAHARALACIDQLRPLKHMQKRVALSPSAAWPTKRWPISHFRALARQLLAAGYAVAVLGSEQERALCAAIASVDPQVDDLSGQFDLPTLAAFLSRVDGHVVGDTGPMHIGRAVGCPTVALFGSTSPDAFVAEDDVFLSKRLDCAPCSYHGREACPLGTLACLQQLSTEEVLNALKRRLAKPCFGPDARVLPDHL